MSGSKGSSKEKRVQLTARESKLQDLNIEFVEGQLAAFGEAAGFQDFANALTEGAFEGIGDLQDIISAVPSADREAFTKAEFDRAVKSGQLSDELLDLELARIKRGGAASEEQIRLIDEATEASISGLRQDVDTGTRDALTALREELAPGKGLRPTDTPILDRGGLIAREAQRQVTRGVTELRGNQLKSRLNFPLAADQATGSASQFAIGTSASTRDIQRELSNRAFASRLALTGQTGQQRLTLAGLGNPAATQEACKPVLAASSKNASGGVSSRELKDLISRISGHDALEKIRKLAIYFYHYKPEAGQGHEKHIGPVAEDFKEVVGIGDGKTINYLDAIGLLMAAVQALAGDVDGLRAEVAA